MKQIKSLAVGIAMAAVGAMASAAPWSQTLDFNPDIYIGPAHTWTHSLAGAGFDPLDDVITSFNLSVTIVDEQDPTTNNGRRETANLNLPGIVADEVWSSGNTTWTSRTIVTGGSIDDWLPPLTALLQLNFFGELTVTLSADRGDFMLGSSTLRADGKDGRHHDNKVPEPATLALVGLSMAGLALRQRRRVAPTA